MSNISKIEIKKAHIKKNFFAEPFLLIVTSENNEVLSLYTYMLSKEQLVFKMYEYGPFVVEYFDSEGIIDRADLELRNQEEVITFKDIHLCTNEKMAVQTNIFNTLIQNKYPPNKLISLLPDDESIPYWSETLRNLLLKFCENLLIEMECPDCKASYLRYIQSCLRCDTCFYIRDI